MFLCHSAQEWDDARENSLSVMEDVADFLYDLPRNYALLFDAAHYIVCVDGLRSGLGGDYEVVSRSHPLVTASACSLLSETCIRIWLIACVMSQQACWLAAMILCFAGNILTTALCGQSMLQSITEDNLRLASATIIWYLIFYSPKDVGVSILRSTLLRIPVSVMKGLYYPKKIVAGIKYAKLVNNVKSNHVAGLALAMAKANGSGFLRPFAFFLLGIWKPSNSESLFPSMATKYCFLCACLYLVCPSDATYIIMIVVMVAFKTAPIFEVHLNPFTRVEQVVSPKLFGVPKRA